MGVQGVDNLLAARIERGLVVLPWQADDNLVQAGHVKVLNTRVLDAGRFHGLANGVDVGAVGKLHLHLGTAAKVHTQWHRRADMRPVPAHLCDAGNTKNHGKGEEVPLIPQPVHIYAAKEFHCFFFPSLL